MTGRPVIEASAPGKLLLLGEYAVLQGAPALVAAVDRFATARIKPRDDERYRLIAPEIDPEPIEFQLSGDGVRWTAGTNQQTGQQTRKQTDLVDAALTTALDADLLGADAGFDLTLSNPDFYHEGNKLGIGSSAAVTVALCRALIAASGKPTDLLALAQLAHSRFQHGQGSGSDIAACASGGVIGFQIVPDVKDTGSSTGSSTGPSSGSLIEQLSWPMDLHWQCFWTGHSTSTPGYLTAVDDLANADPDRHSKLMEKLGRLAVAGHQAFVDQDVERFLVVVDQYHAAMDQLGQVAGIDVVSQTHQQLGRLAREQGAAYKASGAGGGDIGIAFGTVDALARTAARVAEAKTTVGASAISLTLADIQNH